MAKRGRPKKASSDRRVTPKFFVRLSEEIREPLEKASEDDSRTMTGKVELIVKQWLKDNGYVQ